MDFVLFGRDRIVLVLDLVLFGFDFRFVFFMVEFRVMFFFLKVLFGIGDVCIVVIGIS